MPQAKLYFYQTGTSIPQAVYSDSGLSAPLTQPVVANSDGIFPPIFMDPNSTEFRVTLTDSAGVTQSGYPVDNVPPLSIAGNSLHYLRVSSDIGAVNAVAVTLLSPQVTLYTDGLFIYVHIANTNTSRIVTVNVNSLGAITLKHVNGSEPLIGELQAGKYVLLSYNSGTSEFNLLASDYSAGVHGTYTGTITGLSTTPSASFEYTVSGGMVTMRCTSGSSGTSNSTAMAITGFPQQIWPAINTYAFGAVVTDNGGTVLSICIMSTAGTLNFYLLGTAGAAGTINNFTGSGTKGIVTGWAMTYPL